jgi:uncharacterized protein (DUF1697 family)
MSETRVALLRGINVGGKNKLPMKDLIEMFDQARCSAVRSYIQSGNVIFCASATVSVRLPSVISASITRRFGFTVPVLLRSLEEIAQVLASNPFLHQGAPEDELHVMFLSDAPAPARIAALDPHRSSPDSFQVIGQEIYLRLPGGMADTKLTNAYFDSKLATVSTGRNWRTVSKLFELMKQ